MANPNKSAHNSPIPDDLLTTNEAALILNKSPRTLQSWRTLPQKTQPIGYYFDGVKVWYSETELRAYMEKKFQRFGPVPSTSC